MCEMCGCNTVASPAVSDQSIQNESSVYLGAIMGMDSENTLGALGDAANRG
jgi:hypothetical protein